MKENSQIINQINQAYGIIQIIILLEDVISKLLFQIKINKIKL
jgi:hypothetical protein